MALDTQQKLDYLLRIRTSYAASVAPIPTPTFTDARQESVWNEFITADDGDVRTDLPEYLEEMDDDAFNDFLAPLKDGVGIRSRAGSITSVTGSVSGLPGASIPVVGAGAGVVPGDAAAIERRKQVVSQRWELAGYTGLAVFGAYLAVVYFGATSIKFAKELEALWEKVTGQPLPLGGEPIALASKVGAIGANVPFNAATFLGVAVTFIEAAKEAYKQPSRVKSFSILAGQSIIALGLGIIGTLGYYRIMREESWIDQLLAGIQNTLCSIWGVIGLRMLLENGYYGTKAAIANSGYGERTPLLSASTNVRALQNQLEALALSLKYLKSSVIATEVKDLTQDTGTSAIVVELLKGDFGDPQINLQGLNLAELLAFINSLPKAAKVPSLIARILWPLVIALLCQPAMLGLGLGAIDGYGIIGILAYAILIGEMLGFGFGFNDSRMMSPTMYAAPLAYKILTYLVAVVFVGFAVFSWPATGKATIEVGPERGWTDLGTLIATGATMLSTIFSNSIALLPFMVNMFSKFAVALNSAKMTDASLADQKLENVVKFLNRLATELPKLPTATQDAIEHALAPAPAANAMTKGIN